MSGRIIRDFVVVGAVSKNIDPSVAAFCAEQGLQIPTACPHRLVINGTEYRKNVFLVAAVESEARMHFGKIICIFRPDNAPDSEWMFLVENYIGTFDPHKHAFNVDRTGNLSVKSLSAFLDFHPLDAVGAYIRLKYWVF